MHPNILNNMKQAQKNVENLLRVIESITANEAGDSLESIDNLLDECYTELYKQKRLLEFFNTISGKN